MNCTILMLEDDEDDRYITQTVFDENHSGVTIQFTTTRQQLMNYFRESPTNKSGFPSLILLNYHAVASNAVEILKELKSNEAYRHIPVVALSGCVHAAIVKECTFMAPALSFKNRLPMLKSRSPILSGIGLKP